MFNKRESKSIAAPKSVRDTLFDAALTGNPKGTPPQDSDFFHQAILKLEIVNNAASGYIEVNTTPKTYILYRDATAEIKNDETAFHNWAILGLNYFSAAKKLMKSANLNYLETQADNFLKNIELKNADPEKEFLRMVHKVLIPAVVKDMGISLKKAKKHLEAVKDFSNLDYPAIALATKNQISDQHILQVSVPLVGGMPEDLRKEYESVANNTHAADYVAWYKDQPDYLKEHIRAAANQVLAGKMIPTQLRNRLPGLRNAWEDRLYDVTDKNKSQLIYRGYHSGTPGHVFKKDSWRGLVNDIDLNHKATKQTVAQIKNLLGKDVIIQSLLTPTAFITDDSHLVQQMQASTTELKVGYINNPVNRYRYVAPNVQNHVVENFVNETESNTKNKYTEIKPQQVRYAADPENLNLQRSTYFSLMASESKRPSITSCKSGKDRRGVHGIHVHTLAIKAHLPDSKESEIRDTLCNNGHAQKLAGFFGATLGADGIKEDSLGAIPASWGEQGPKLIEKTAKYNHTVPKVSNKPFYKRPKFWLFMLALILGLLLCATGSGALLGAPLLFANMGALSASCSIVSGVTVTGAALYPLYKIVYKTEVLPKEPDGFIAYEISENKPTKEISVTVSSELQPLVRQSSSSTTKGPAYPAPEDEELDNQQITLDDGPCSPDDGLQALSLLAPKRQKDESPVEIDGRSFASLRMTKRSSTG